VISERFVPIFFAGLSSDAMICARRAFSMVVTGLLLLTSLLAVPSEAATYAVQPETAGVQEAPGVSDFDWNFHLPRLQSSDALADTGTDRTCYKIRAYIFKRDDDHAPELVGSTTCGPRQAHKKNIVWPKARLVPVK
jgi:hypothetical protein